MLLLLGTQQTKKPVPNKHMAAATTTTPRECGDGDAKVATTTWPSTRSTRGNCRVVTRLPGTKKTRTTPLLLVQAAVVLVACCLHLADAFAPCPSSTIGRTNARGVGERRATAFDPTTAKKPWQPTGAVTRHDPFRCNVGQTRLCRTVLPLSATRLDDEKEEDDDDDYDGDDDQDGSSSTGRLRKRDRIKDWFTQTTAGGGSDDSRKRVKTKFDSLFSGMPSVNEILSDNSQQEEMDDASMPGSRPSRRGGRNKDPSWFENEKKRIMDR